MDKRIINLIVEFRELMIQTRGLPSIEATKSTRKKIKQRKSEIFADLVDNHWDEIPPDIRKRIGLVQRKK